MRTSAPGNKAAAQRAPLARARRAGFTLIELLVVLAIVAIASGLAVAALRDGQQAQLDEEGARLGALLAAARAEARASGVAVRWQLASADTAAASDGSRADFRFVGLPDTLGLPTRWLREGTSAEIVGARAVLLGPEPILPAQRIVLRLGERSLVLASDGLAPFSPAAP